jgi:hypothetical protein
MAHNYLPWENFNIILTDNGSEFAKDFAKYLSQIKVTHHHTYGNLLFDDLDLFTLCCQIVHNSE